MASAAKAPCPSIGLARTSTANFCGWPRVGTAAGSSVVGKKLSRGMGAIVA